MKNDLIDRLHSGGIDVIGAVSDDPAVFQAGLEGKTIGPCEASRAAGSILGHCLGE
jgi:hypothetical protein